MTMAATRDVSIPASESHPVTASDISARIDRLPASRAIWKIIIMISFGSFFEFYDLFLTGYIAPGMVKEGLFTDASLGSIASLKAISIAGVGTFVSSTFVGLWLGVMLLSQIADRFGRRPIFKWALLWYVFCSLIMALQTTGFSVNLWRMIAGIGIGVQAVTVDVFIAELIPASTRGRAYAVSQTIAFCALPAIALLAWLLLPVELFGLAGWRWVVMAGTVGACAIWFLLLAIPESPRWLARNGRLAEADAIVSELERRVAADIKAPLPAPDPSVVVEAGGKGALREIFIPFYRGRTIMLVILNLTQTIGFYGFAAWVPTLLIHRGVHITESLLYSFIIACTNPFGPLMGTLFADRFERKWQIVATSFGMLLLMALFSQLNATVPLIVVGMLFALVSNIMGYTFHAYMAELFPTRIRARAVGFAYSWSRVSGAGAGLFIGYLLGFGGVPAVAIFIGTAMIIQMTAVGLLGPSTRQLSLENINR